MTEETNERTQAHDDADILSALLEPDGYHVEFKRGGLQLLDSDGDGIVTLPPELVSILVAPTETRITQRDVAHIVKWLDDEFRAQWTRAYNAGVREGKTAMTNTVHELLGVDKLAQMIDDKFSDLIRSVDNCAPR